MDIGSAKLADTPNVFDVVVLPNLYGDILSDVAAQIAGSVGLAGSANIGVHGAMFEAIHGSAPRRAGQNMANPSGLILASVMMMAHVGLAEIATQIHNAWACTLEEGIHTYDIFKPEISKQKVGTIEFAKAVAERLGKKPHTLKAAHYSSMQHLSRPHEGREDKAIKKELMGVDVFIQSYESVEHILKQISALKLEGLKLSMIGNRGAKVWPNTMPETSFSDSFRCRFMSKTKGLTIAHKEVVALLNSFAEKNIDFTHVENLYNYDGKPGYTVSQDQQ